MVINEYDDHLKSREIKCPDPALYLHEIDVVEYALCSRQWRWGIMIYLCLVLVMTANSMMQPTIKPSATPAATANAIPTPPVNSTLRPYSTTSTTCNYVTHAKKL